MLLAVAEKTASLAVVALGGPVVMPSADDAQMNKEFARDSEWPGFGPVVCADDSYAILEPVVVYCCDLLQQSLDSHRIPWSHEIIFFIRTW